MTTSTTNQTASSHDSDSVTQVVSLIHKMCGKENDSVSLVAFQKLPNVPSCGGIHTWGWLIQYNDFWSSCKSHGHRKTSLLPTWKILWILIFLLIQVDITDEFFDFFIKLLPWETSESSKEFQMLLDSKIFIESIMLWTDSNALSDFL